MSVNTSTPEKGAVLLSIPVEMRLPQRTYRTTLRVGPFESDTEARKWERGLARGLVENTPPRGYVEARTVLGQSVKAVYGRERAEIRIAPPGSNPLIPERHFVVSEGMIVAYCGPQFSYLNPDKVSGAEVGNNIGIYVGRRIAETA